MIIPVRDQGKGIGVFAVDPGEVTGWAYCCVAWKELEQKGITDSLAAARRHKSGYMLGDTRFATGQVDIGPWSRDDTEAQGIARLFCVLVAYDEMVRRASAGAVNGITDVVIEDFLVRERTMDKSLVSPVRVTSGLVQELFNWGGRVTLDYQQPSDAKSVVTDARLKKWNLYVDGKHARDAVRHLVLYLRRL